MARRLVIAGESSLSGVARRPAEGRVAPSAVLFDTGNAARKDESDRRFPLGVAHFPCSAAQRRFWVLDRIDPGTPSLNVAVRWRLEGRIAPDNIAKAFSAIVERHSALRTFFSDEEGEPLQMVAPFVPFHVPVIDLTDRPQDEAFAEAERIAQMEAGASFDLTMPPLIRVTHLRVRDEVSIILVTAHHMICDGWSIGILAREMGTLCAAYEAGQTPELPALPLSYGEYSARQAHQQGGDTVRQDEAFWSEALRDLKPFELQPDRPRPPLRTANGRIESLLLDAGTTDMLQALSRRQGCTLFMTALSVMLTLLHRYSGESDIAIGTQVAGRDDVDIEDAVGLFINTIVLRSGVSGDSTFVELMDRVSDRVFDAFDHRGTSFDRLVEMLKPRRDQSRNPLFSINFVFQRSFIQNQQYGGFRLIDLPSCPAGSLYDLNFFMVERPDGWRASCDYNTDLFDRETVRSMLRHFANLLAAAASDPEQKLSGMPMLDDAERQALTLDVERSRADYPRQLTMPGLFELQAKRTPEAVAVICGEQSLSFADLDVAANRLAHELSARGIGAGTRVGICLDRSVDLLVALLAVLKSGAAYIPLDPAYPATRLAQIFEDARPGVLLTRAALRDRVPCGDLAVLLLDAEAAAIERRPGTPLDSSPLPDAVAYVIYTSGSTGRPKGVQIQHRALTNLLWAMRDRPGLTASDTLLAVTTVSFDIAALELFLPLITGARLVLAQEEQTVDGAALLGLLEAHRVTVLQATPVTWQLLLAAGWRAGPSLKMLCGGEAMPRKLADQLIGNGGELWNLYGPTETTIWSSVHRVGPGTGSVPIGAPIANTQFYVLDAQRQLVPAGVPGELYIGGDGVALGYLNLPEMTAQRFVVDPFRQDDGARLYRTGDLVRRKRDGHIEFLGRADHLVKLRGFRIELGEIESVLRAQPQVAEGVALVVTDASGEPALRAYVVPQRLTPEQAERLVGTLLAALRQTLPAYMVPGSIVVLDALPRTPNGKTDRNALLALVPAAGQARKPASPVGGLEQTLIDIWCAILGVPELDTDANFFEMGGNSLLAVRMLARVESAAGRKLSLAALFRGPTIRELARLLRTTDARAFDFRQVMKLQPNGSRSPLIAINNTGIFYNLSKHLGFDQPFTSLQLFDPSLPNVVLPKTLEDIAAGYVQLIRRVQPQGPYSLLGWCVAGTLAFEIARQLDAAGHQVDQLVMLDTWAPGHLKRMPRLKSRFVDYVHRAHLIAIDLRKSVRGEGGLVAFLARRRIVMKLMSLFRPPAALPQESAQPVQAQAPEQYDLWLLNYLQNAVDAYEPKPYRGRVQLIRSLSEPRSVFLDWSMGWNAFMTRSKVEVVAVQGDHFTMFQEPGVSQIARGIEAALGRAVQRD